MQLHIFALTGIPEIVAGEDLGATIIDAADHDLRDGDILTVTSKIVSKAEGRSVKAQDREQAITNETVRVIASRKHPAGVTRIVENRLGIVAAAAGVDNSNVPAGTVLLLPKEPDLSAQRIRTAIYQRTGISVGVIITDTLGRAWRIGQTDAAIGIAGIPATLDLRGQYDDHGQRMEATVIALADEIAAAADLIKGKTKGRPVAVVRGLSELVSDSVPENQRSAAALIRPRNQDMFNRGSSEAWHDGYRAALKDHHLQRPAADPPREAWT